IVADTLDDDVVGVADVVEEFALFLAFHGEAADHGDAGEDFVESSVNAGPVVEQGVFAAGLFGGCAGCDQGGDGGEEQNDNEQAPVDVEHQGAGDDQVSNGG